MKQYSMEFKSKFSALVATILFCFAPVMAQTLIWDTEECSGPYEPWYSYTGDQGSISPSEEEDFQTAWCDAGGTAYYSQTGGNANLMYGGIGFEWSADEEIDISSHSAVCVTYSLEKYGAGEKASLALPSSLITDGNNYSVVLEPTVGEKKQCFDFSDFTQESWGITVPKNEVLNNSRGLEFRFNGTWRDGTVTLTVKKIEWLPLIAITGPANMTLTAGYEATSTDIFDIFGEEQPLSVTPACNNCDDKISWNEQDKKLDIEAGLTAGTYTVTLTVLSSSESADHLFTLTVLPPLGTFAEGVIWESESCKDEYGRYLSVNGGFGDGWWSAYRYSSGSGGSLTPAIDNNFHENLCDGNGKVEYNHSSSNTGFGISFELATVSANIGDKEGVCITYSLESEQQSSYPYSLSLAIVPAEENGDSPTEYDDYSINIPKTNGTEVRKCFIFSEFQQSGWGTIVDLNQILQNAKSLQIKSLNSYATATLDIKKIEWLDVDLDELPPIGTFAEGVIWDNENCADVYNDYPRYLPVNVGYDSQWYTFTPVYSDYGNKVSLVPAADDNFHKNLCKSGGNVEFSGTPYASIGFNLTETAIDLSDKDGVCITYSLQNTNNDNDLALEIIPMEGEDGSITGDNEYNAKLPPTNGQEVRKCFAFEGDFKQRYKSGSQDLQYGTYVPLDLVLENAKALQLRMMNRNDWGEWYTEVQGNLDIKKIEWMKITLPGSGTEQDPYIITEAEQLELIARKINAGKEGYNGSDVYYELGKDIDLAAYPNWRPIGNVYGYWVPSWHQRDSSFKANFDGKGYKIRNLTITSRNDLTINGSPYRGMGTGLFGVINGGTVQNLGLENVNITADGDGVGGIAGQLWGLGIIRNSYVAGGVIKTTTSISATDDRAYGGIAGRVSGNINYCYSTADIFVNTVSTSSGIISVGGIAGHVFNDVAYEAPGSVKNSIALGQVVSNKGQTGFTGRIAYGDGILTNNFAFSGMLNKDNNTEWNNKGSDKLDGEDREAYELFEANGYLPVFASSPWAYVVGKLPGLNEEPVDMPPHINIPTDGITKVVIAPKTVNVQKGKTQSFDAMVHGFGDFSQTAVTWEREYVGTHNPLSTNTITPNPNNSANAVLSVAATEYTDQVIRIIVTATYDGTIKKDTAIVTVAADPVPPAIQGDTELTEREGYEAFSTNAYSVTGTSQPITVEKISGDAKITWNSTTNKLDIAAGLAAETYEVVLKATDAENITSTFTFTLTVLPVPTVTGVTVTPSTATVQKDQSQTFTAIVEGTNDPSQEVTWSIDGNQSAGTSISRDGILYIAPEETEEELTVWATSVADDSKRAKATVTVTEDIVPPTIEGPETYILVEGYAAQSISGYVLNGTQPITVDVSAPLASGKITWNGATNSLEIAPGLTPSETGLTDGIYYATITAKNKAGDEKVGTLQFTLTVNPAPGVKSIAVEPNSPYLKKGDTQQFSAIVTSLGDVNEAVEWSVNGNVAATNITADGLLTIAASETATNLTVIATSVLNPQVKGYAYVSIGTAPVVVGPANMELNVGYASTSSEEYILNGDPTPTVEIEGIAPSTDLITWNEDDNKFDIAAGLTAGVYTVTYEATNSVGKSQYTFTLTVTTAPAIAGPATQELIIGYAATSSEEYILTGIPTPTVTIETAPSTALITWDAATNKLDIAAGLTAGTYTVTLTAENIAGQSEPHTFTLTVKAPAVTAVAVAPNVATLKKGDTLTFSAIVTVVDGASEEVVWSINNSETSAITPAGILTVDASEAAAQLTVIATSVFDPSKKDSAIVTVATVPTIAGPEALELIAGYAAISSEAYTLTGVPAPSVEIATAPSTDLITWNAATNMLDIAAGIAAGVYTVTLNAANIAGTTPHTFTLTVIAPAVTAITVAPDTTTLNVGDTLTFSATVATVGGATQEVEWSVSGNLAATTTITQTGILTIGATETAAQLTVIATSKFDGQVKDSATVTVATTPIIAGVPKANTLQAWMQNGTLRISGLTAGKTWSIYTISGALVKQSVASGTSANVNLDIARGVYIVKSNGRVVRFVNR